MNYKVWQANNGPRFTYAEGTRFPLDFSGSIVLFSFPGFLGFECRCPVCLAAGPVYQYEYETILIV